MQDLQIIITIIVYLTLLNLTFYYYSSLGLIYNYISSFSTNKEVNITEEIQQVGIIDKVEVSVLKKRWYGEIKENSRGDILKVFNLIPLPMKIRNIKLIYLHFLIGVMLFYLKKQQLNFNMENYGFEENTFYY